MKTLMVKVNITEGCNHRCDYCDEELDSGSPDLEPVKNAINILKD